MLYQLTFKKKRIEHLLYAIFSGSLAIVALQFLSANTLGPYQFILAFGTCATCNVIWLLSRALFRGEQSLSIHHYVFAASIAGLVVASRSIDFMTSIQWIDQQSISWLERSLGEVSQLMSSTALALTLWEALRGYSSSSESERWQRRIFASTFLGGLFFSKVVGHGALSKDMYAEIQPWLVVICALAILCATFTVIVWQQRLSTQSIELKPDQKTRKNDIEISDLQMLHRIEHLMEQEQLFLKSDLKMVDIANRLTVSEYKISRAIRNVTAASNFNHYINTYRLAYAKNLLTMESSKHWTTLVISLESGFASIAPFHRAFKAQEGCTPSQFRKNARTSL